MEDNNVSKILERLLEKSKLGNILESPVRVSGGLLNRMYKVKTDEGLYAIKLLNPEVMKRKNAKDNHIFAEKVSSIAKENGVSCLPAKSIGEEELQEIDGYYFLVFDWIDGKVISDEDLDIYKVKKVAKELAKLHKINYDSLKDMSKAYYNTSVIDWNFYINRISNKELKKLLEENIENFKKWDKDSISSLEKISKNMVISHRDLDLPNVLWNTKNEPVIIDWESAGLINTSMEVIDTGWNWAGGQNFFEKEKFITFINTYKENGGELNDFDEAIRADFKAKFEWLEYNLKRACGIECIDEEERELGKKEAIRTIDEINKFYNIFINNMK